MEQLQQENTVLDGERENLMGAIGVLEKDIEHYQAERHKVVTELQQDKVAVMKQLQQEIDRLHSELEGQQQRVATIVHVMVSVHVSSVADRR